MAQLIELLWCDGCPSHQQALAELREILTELGHDDAHVEVRRIAGDDEALAERFIGSPTIRVGGADVLAPDDAEPAALSCRVYRRRDGRASPTPDRDDLREALAAALGYSRQ